MPNQQKKSTVARNVSNSEIRCDASRRAGPNVPERLRRRLHPRVDSVIGQRPDSCEPPGESADPQPAAEDVERQNGLADRGLHGQRAEKKPGPSI